MNNNPQTNSIAFPGEKSKRLEVIDLLRGITLISMIAYHAAWDLVYLFGVDWPFYRSFGGYVWQQSICWSFILLSGFCMTIGHHPVKRGLLVFACGAAVTGATWFFMPSSIVLFGILTFIGSAMLLGACLLWAIGDIKPPAALAAAGFCFAAFMMTKPVNIGMLLTGQRLPAGWYKDLWSAYFGFPPGNFYSTDYFSLFPWLFLFLTGLFLGLASGPAVKKRLEKAPLHFLQSAGRHSLLIYMLHQPVLYLAFSLLFHRGL